MTDDFDIEAYLEAAVDGKGHEQVRVAFNTPCIFRANSYQYYVNAMAFVENIAQDMNRVSNDRDDRVKDRERDKDVGRDRAREKDRDRDRRRRSRSRERRSSRSRSGERRNRRDRDERKRSRSRSGGRRDRRRDDRDKDSGRDRDRDKTDKRREEETVEVVIDDAEALARKEADKMQKAIDDLTKDQRTVFISQLTVKANEKMVRDYFSQIGGVNNVIMIRDKFTGKHKGFAYVELRDVDTIPTCLLLNGVAPDFQKFPILVKASEAEKNFLAKKEAAAVIPTHASGGQPQGNSGGSIYGPGAGGQQTAGGTGDRRVYVGNLHVNITEEDLAAVLRQVGPLDSLHISRDEVGTSKGYAFASFSKIEDAQKALTSLSGIELAGRSIKVNFVTDGGNHHNGGASASVQQYGSNAEWKFDDDEGSGVQMNSQSRSMLMARLGKSAGIEMPAPPPPPVLAQVVPPAPVAPATAPPVSGQLSSCFVMKNMFVLEEETEEDWAEYIQEDVTGECEKFGAVLHCHVERVQPGGMVYMRFSTPQAASAAANSLNGRWFAGRMITVAFVDPQEYAAHFSKGT